MQIRVFCGLGTQEFPTLCNAMEIDLATKQIQNLTALYAHYGCTRALYLANGDILLSGPETFTPETAGQARRNCLLR